MMSLWRKHWPEPDPLRCRSYIRFRRRSSTLHTFSANRSLPERGLVETSPEARHNAKQLKASNPCHALRPALRPASLAEPPEAEPAGRRHLLAYAAPNPCRSVRPLLHSVRGGAEQHTLGCLRLAGTLVQPAEQKSVRLDCRLGLSLEARHCAESAEVYRFTRHKSGTIGRLPQIPKAGSIFQLISSTFCAYARRSFITRKLAALIQTNSALHYISRCNWLLVTVSRGNSAARLGGVWLGWCPRRHAAFLARLCGLPCALFFWKKKVRSAFHSCSAHRVVHSALPKRGRSKSAFAPQADKKNT